MADPKKVKMGKKSRAQGKAFEVRVRKDLEEKGWIVDRWTNNVEFEDLNNISDEEYDLLESGEICTPGKLIPAKAKWNNFTKSMMMGSGGFPDFVALNWMSSVSDSYGKRCRYESVGVECKTNGTLDKVEKEKCRWMLDNHIFSKILIAERTKVKNRVVIVYHDFEEKYGK